MIWWQMLCFVREFFASRIKNASQPPLPISDLRSVVIRSTVLTGLIACCLLAACSSPRGEQRSRDDQDQRPRVLATFTVLADLARNVAGDRLKVESITKPGAEIHGYEFTPSDIERASRADLIVENGLGLELWARRFHLAPVQSCLSEVCSALLVDGGPGAVASVPLRLNERLTDFLVHGHFRSIATRGLQL